MSQQALATSSASRSARRLGLHWWSLTMTLRNDVADGIVNAVVAPLSAKIPTLGVKRWYFDAVNRPDSGVVRLRVLARIQVLDALRFEAEALRKAHDSNIIVDEKFEAEDTSGRILGSVDSSRGAELVAFGGAQGLSLSEEIFELGSEIALFSRERFPNEPARMAFASLFIADAARAMMFGRYAGTWSERKDMSPEAYWSAHARSCFRGELSSDECLHRFVNTVGTRSGKAHGIMMAISAEPQVSRLRKRWIRAIDLYLQRCYRARVCRSATQLTQQQVHLLLQRIGLSLKDEAIAGVHARVWEERGLPRPR